MTCDRTAQVVGAYLLGALEPAERAAAEEHLRGCASCSAELAELRGVPAQLDRVAPDDPPALAPPPELFERVSAATRDRTPHRRRWLAAVAAAAVIGAAGGTWALLDDDELVRSATSGSVRMSVVASAAGDGTGLEVTVGGLPRGAQCRLLVQEESGDWHRAGEWTVDYVGEASYDVWTTVDPADLTEILLLDDDRELIRIDLS